MADQETIELLNQYRKWAGNDPVKLQKYEQHRQRISRDDLAAEGGVGSELGEAVSAGVGYMTSPWNMAKAPVVGVLNTLGAVGRTAQTIGVSVHANAQVLANKMGLAPDGSVASDYDKWALPNFDPSYLTGLNDRAPENYVVGPEGITGTGRKHESAYGNMMEAQSPGSIEMGEQRGDLAASDTAFAAAEFGTDPLTALGLGSGVKAAIKGRRLVSMAKGLIAKGVNEAKVADMIASKLGREPSAVMQMLGIETPHDYFTKGKLFNRNPVVNLFGSGGHFAKGGDELIAASQDSSMLPRMLEGGSPPADAPLMDHVVKRDLDNILGQNGDAELDNLTTAELQALDRKEELAFQSAEDAKSAGVRSAAFDQHDTEVAGRVAQAENKAYTTQELKFRVAEIAEQLDGLAPGTERRRLQTELDRANALLERHNQGLPVENARSRVWRFGDGEQRPNRFQRMLGQAQADSQVRNQGGTLAKMLHPKGVPNAGHPGQTAVGGIDSLGSAAQRLLKKKDLVTEFTEAEATGLYTDAQKAATAKYGSNFGGDFADELASSAMLDIVEQKKAGKFSKYDTLPDEERRKVMATAIRNHIDTQFKKWSRNKDNHHSSFDKLTGDGEQSMLDVFSDDVDTTNDLAGAGMDWASESKEQAFSGNGRLDKALTAIAEQGDKQSMYVTAFRLNSEGHKPAEIARRMGKNEMWVGRALNSVRSEMKSKLGGELSGYADDLADEAFSLATEGSEGARKSEVMAAVNRSPHVRESTLTADGMDLILNNGAKVTLRTEQDLASPQAGKVVKGRIIMSADGTTIDLTKAATADTFDHELVHFARKSGLFTESEWASLAKYGDEEGIANALSGLSIENPTLWRKIKDFFANIYEVATGRATTTGTEAKWGKGDIAGRKPSDILKGDKTLFSTGDAPGIPGESHVRTVADSEHTRGMVSKMLDSVRLSKGEKVDRARDALFDAHHSLKKALGAVHDKLDEAGFLTLDEAAVSPKMRMELAAGKESLGSRVLLGETPLPGKAHEGKPIKFVNLLSDYVKSVAGNKATNEAKEAVLKELGTYMNAKRFVGEAEHMEKALANGNLKPFEKIFGEGHIKGLTETGLTDASRAELRAGLDDWSKSFSGVSGKEGDDLGYYRAWMEDHASKVKQYEAVAKPIRQLNSAGLDAMRDAGMLNKEAYAELKGRSDFYTAVQRVFDEDELRGIGFNDALIKSFKGSERTIADPVTTSMEMYSKIIKRTENNKMWQSMVGKAHEAKSELKLAEKMADADPEACEILSAAANETLGIFEDLVERVPSQRSDTVKVHFDGEETHWRFKDARLAEQASTLRKPTGDNNLAWKIAKLPANVLRGALSASPRYAVFNLVRDSITRSALSLHSHNPAAGFLKTADGDIHKFINAGGDQSAGLFGEFKAAWETEQARSLKMIGNKRGNAVATLDQAFDKLSQTYDWMTGMTGSLEQRNRMAEFVAARKDIMKSQPGLSDETYDMLAAHGAREFMDFAVAGSSIRTINEVIPFVNAGVQGARTMFRQIGRDPKLVLGKMGALSVAATTPLMLAMAGGYDKEYRELPAYRRDFYFNFKLGNNWITVPKPFELGVLTTGLERAVDAAAGNKHAFEGYLTEPGSNINIAGGSLFQSLTPMDESTMLGPWKPLVEAITGRDMFRDRDIIPSWERDLAPELRKGAKKASRQGRLFQSITGTDGRLLDHVVSSMFGDYGRLVTNIGKANKAGDATSITKKFLGVARDVSPYGRSTNAIFRMNAELGNNRTKSFKKFTKMLQGYKADPTQSKLHKIIERSKVIEERTEKNYDRLFKQKLKKLQG